ncbi:MAG: sugar ABC transporter permease [Lachnospiraceae bacterium]|nr:sugar ABC transporter permease [Lachnospiraceae bacterium]
MGRKNGKIKVKLSAMAKREERWALLFVAAPAIGFLLFMLWPIIFAFLTSLTTWTGAKGFAGMLDRFCGFDNYVKLMTDTKFWKTVLTTVIYLIGIPVGMILGLTLAMGMNKKIPGVRVLRTMYYIPVISSLVAVSILWAWVYNYDYGLLNVIIKTLTGMHGPNWLGDEVLIKVSMIIFMVWKGLGTSIILYLAGLQNIPRSYYEAAMVDGANGWQQFRNITLPLLSPVTFYIVITTLIGGFQVFVEVQVMVANGGIGYSAATIVFYLYEKAFESYQLGYASAIAIILAIIIFIITLINFKMQDKWVKTID